MIFLFLFLPNLTNSQIGKDGIPEEEGENRSLREEWFYKQRALPFDEIPENARMQAYEQDKILSRFFNKNLLQVSYPTWINVGPSPAATMSYSPLWGNISGRMRSVAVHPLNPDIIYIGAANGGVWKTTNGGLSWFPLTENEASLAMGAIAIDPNNPEIIFAGTGEALAGTDRTTYFGSGFLKSTNGGNTWTRITNGFGSNTHFSKIAVRSSNSNFVYAALAQGLWYAATPNNQGVWRSTDGGTNWTRTLNVTRAFDVIIHPTGQDTVYASVGNAASSSGFYKSTDAGLTWVQQNSGLVSASSIRRMHISQSQNSPSTIYSVIYSSDSTRVFKSTNGGGSWFRTGGNYWFGGIWGSTYYDQGWYDLHIAVNPQNPDIVYVGNVDLMKTTNGGTSWTRLVTSWDGKAHVDQHAMAFHPSEPNTIFIVNDGGINKSTNGGSTFTSLNSDLSITQFYHIATSPHDVTHLIGGTQDNATQRRPPGSSNWVGVIGGDGGQVVFDYSNPNFIYGEYVYGSIYRSQDGGNSFYQITSGLLESGAWIAPILIHPTIPTTLYTATYRVYQTTDRGSNWTPISNALLGTTRINAMDISSTNPNLLLALASEGTSSPAVFISSDGALNWQNITSGLPTRYMTRVRFHPDSSNILFVTVSGFGTGHVYRSTNSGNSWTNISTSLPDIPANDIFIDPTNANNRYFVATDLGVYVTEDAGLGWVKLIQSFPNTAAVSFSYHSATRILRVGTHGRGIFEMALPQITGNISGKKYFDVEQDSSIASNTGLAGWVIKLYKNGLLQTRTVTDGSGNYSFNSFPPGTYTVEESLSTGWMQTFPRVSSLNVTLTNYGYNAGSRAYLVSLVEGANITNIDFGNFQFGSISGKKYFDVERDSSIIGNPKIENWVIKLFKDGLLERRAVTNTEGDYIFSNLNAGTYTVEESLKTDWIQTYPRVGAAGVVLNTFGQNAGSRAYSLEVTGSSNVSGKDFGNYAMSSISVNRNLNEGWNLVSVPLYVLDWYRDAIFPNTSAEVYGYSGKYIQANSLSSGQGYWVKYSSPQNIFINGWQILSDSIQLRKGWNIVGSISDSVLISSLTTDPPGILASQFFGFNSGYYNADKIKPMEGYWIKAANDGKLYLSQTTSSKLKTINYAENLSSLNSLTFEAGSKKQTLYFGKNKNRFYGELPPIPPTDAFDVRFETGKFIELIPDKFQNTFELPILIQSNSNPIKITWNVKDGDDVRYQLQNNAENSRAISGSGVLEIEDIKNISLIVTNNSVPEEFALLQNYPNPFNPTTEIKYSLPEISRVRLSVFDVLGREVAVLFSGIQEAGYHNQRWTPENNGLNLSSGIYFYKLDATPVDNPGKRVTEIKKMLFVQ
ncbi:MAG: SdrD B-like domain-containing protein [Bacteroidota bacterium]|nr:SdrD B-like domain-containing protein [Bacteroidota bacterium]